MPPFSFAAFVAASLDLIAAHPLLTVAIYMAAVIALIELVGLLSWKLTVYRCRRELKRDLARGRGKAA